MELAVFEENFHALVAEYSKLSKNHIEAMEEKFEREKKRQLELINSRLDDKIRSIFKQMDLDSKMSFYERYIGRQNLNSCFEQHEITALIIMDWDYVNFLTANDIHPNRVVKHIK